MPSDIDYNVALSKPTRTNQIFGYPGDDVNVILKESGRNNSYCTVIRQVDSETMETKLMVDNRRQIVYMADYGLIAYRSGYWNQDNWVELV